MDMAVLRDEFEAMHVSNLAKFARGVELRKYLEDCPGSRIFLRARHMMPLLELSRVWQNATNFERRHRKRWE